MASNNYFYSTRVSNVSVGGGTLTYTSRVGYGVGFPLLSSAGKTYTLSYSATSSGQPYGAAMYYKQDGTYISASSIGGTGSKTLTFTTPANTYYLVIMFGCDSESDKTVNVSNIQLETGDTATTYEQWIGNVTSETIVTVAADHTLVADWTYSGACYTVISGYTPKCMSGPDLSTTEIHRYSSGQLIRGYNTGIAMGNGYNWIYSYDYSCYVGGDAVSSTTCP